jgi:class 3 adenylate cyclase
MSASFRSRRIPFRVAITTVVVGLLVVTCAFLIVFGLHSARKGMDVLKDVYVEQIAKSMVAEFLRLPSAAALVLRVERYQIETGSRSVADPIAVARALAGELQADADIHWVSYADAATGRFMGAHRIAGGGFVLNVSDPRVDGGVPREFRADTLAPYVPSPPLTEPYDPRTRAWYQRALTRPGVIVWMPPYTFAEGIKGITAALTVGGGSGRVTGVLTVDFALSGVARFVRGIDVGEGGGVAVFDQSGALVAGQPGSGLDAATRAFLELTRTLAEGSEGRKTRHADVLVRGEPWGVAARSLALGPGFEWTVAVAVPEDAFMGPIHADRRAAVAIGLAGVVLAITAGFVLSTGIARSLGGATGVLDRVAHFDLAAAATGRSVLREIALLQDAVGRVAASLRSFTRYAPEEIVREVVASGREAMLSGDKREVSVLFCDLRGFTGFAERTRPEDVVAILNDHFELLVGIIARHRGFVVDFLGDSVFAVFGAPQVDADHAEEAVTCGIEMQRARTARNQDNRDRGWPPLEMGVGIATGPAVVGNMGSLRRIKYGIVGHIVNVAARIETFTVGGQVLVADATRQRLGERLVVAGPVEAEGKGVGAAIRLWEVLELRGESALTLPSAARDLEAVDPPLDAQVRLILGKQIDAHAYAARVHRLGPDGAAIESRAPLAVFGALQVLLHFPGKSAPDALDAKVTGVSELDGVTQAVVRFTGLDWDTRDRLDALVRQRQDQVRSGPAGS